MSKTDSAGKLDVAMPGMQGAQRETGEALVEGVGTLELTATPRGGLRRADVKEASATLRSLTQRAEVTTLVTSEGRSLTEVKLTLKNQSQQFVKVDLAAGASILSDEVAGEKVKPVEGPDGNRVPLLRPGFRPNGAYTVSFVFLHSGAPFTRKGIGVLDLPKMDVPVGVVQWEVFLPKQYAVAGFGGDAIPANLMPAAANLEEFAELRPVGGFGGRGGGGGPLDHNNLSVGIASGSLGGHVVGPTGSSPINTRVPRSAPRRDHRCD
jgi:hypothetical protein